MVNEVRVWENGLGVGKQLYQGIHFSVIKRVYEFVQSHSRWRTRTI